MFPFLLAWLGVSTALALRSGVSSQIEGTQAVDVILSLLQIAEGSEGHSNQQGAVRVLESWSPGVSGSLKAIAAKLQDDVIEHIELGHAETQTRLDQEVKTVGNRALLAATKKEEADEADRYLQGCIETEKDYLQVVVEAENLYNQKMEETVEPCRREGETARFGVTAEEVTMKCETDKDPNCTAAMSEFEKKVDDMKARLTRKIHGKVESHVTAKSNCVTAVESQAAQQDAVIKAQATWNSQSDKCVSSREIRDQKICSFGEKLQEVCAATTSYGELVSRTRGSGSIDSVHDRVAEWNTTQLVLCLLDSLSESSNLTTESVDKCQAKITIAGFDLDVQSIKVQMSLNVSSSPTFKILCEEQESMTFHGGIWEVPEDPQLSEGYEGQVPSMENVTLPRYVFQDSWSTKVTLKVDKSPFAECLASNFRSLRVQADQANSLHKGAGAQNWNVEDLVITDSLGVQASYACKKLQFPREGGKNISCKVEYSGVRWVKDAIPFLAAKDMNPSWDKWSQMPPGQKLWFEISDCDADLTIQSINISQGCYQGNDYYRMSQVEVLRAPALSEVGKKTSKDTVILQGCDGVGSSGQEVLAMTARLASVKDTPPVVECLASNFRSLRVQADQADSLHDWNGAQNWNVEDLVITDSLGVQASWASKKLQFPREGGKDISCKVEYSGVKWVKDAIPFRAAKDMNPSWNKWSKMPPGQKLWFEISDCDANLTIQSINISQGCYKGHDYYRMSQVEVLRAPALSEKGNETCKDTVSLLCCDGVGRSGQEVLAKRTRLRSVKSDWPVAL